MRLGRLRTQALGLAHRAASGRLAPASFGAMKGLRTTSRTKPTVLDPESSTRAEEHEDEPELELGEGVKRSLTVAIMGPPNAGKSVLLNAFVKDHVSAVSRKRNTTSTCILGAVTVGDTQLVFTDTPGAILDRKEAKRVAKDVVTAYRDAVCFATDVMLVADAAKRWNDEYRSCLRHVIREGVENECHVTVVLNKVDLVNPKAKLLDMASEMVAMLEEEQRRAVQTADGKEMKRRLIESQRGPPSPIFMVSATDNDGVSDVLDHLLERATEGDWYLADGEITDMSPQERVRELLKELIFNEFHQEIPYGIDQETRSWEAAPDGSSLVIYHDLLVPSDSYSRILRGRGGARLNQIREKAIPRLQQILKVPRVNLKLWVRVSTTNQSKLKRLRARGG